MLPSRQGLVNPFEVDARSVRCARRGSRRGRAGRFMRPELEYSLDPVALHVLTIIVSLMERGTYRFHTSRRPDPLTFLTLGCCFPILRLMSMNPSYVCETYKNDPARSGSASPSPTRVLLYKPHVMTHAFAPLADDHANQTTPKEGICKGDHPILHQHPIDLFLSLGGVRQQPGSHARARTRMVRVALSGAFRMTMTRPEMSRSGGRRRLEDLDQVFFFHRHRV